MIVKVVADPVQPFAVAVTETVLDIGLLVKLFPVKLEIFPLPLDERPMLVFEFVQLKVAPLDGLVKFIVVDEEPLHIAWLLIILTTGLASTVIVKFPLATTIPEELYPSMVSVVVPEFVGFPVIAPVEEIIVRPFLTVVVEKSYVDIVVLLVGGPEEYKQETVPFKGAAT